MRRLSHNEKIVEKIALLLLDLEDDGMEQPREDQITAWAHEATSMAVRAFKNWWSIPGRPDFNERMSSLRQKWTIRRKG